MRAPPGPAPSPAPGPAPGQLPAPASSPASSPLLSPPPGPPPAPGRPARPRLVPASRSPAPAPSWPRPAPGVPPAVRRRVSAPAGSARVAGPSARGALASSPCRAGHVHQRRRGLREPRTAPRGASPCGLREGPEPPSWDRPGCGEAGPLCSSPCPAAALLASGRWLGRSGGHACTRLGARSGSPRRVTDLSGARGPPQLPPKDYFVFSGQFPYFV